MPCSLGDGMLSDVREQPIGVRFLRRVVEGHLRFPLLLVGPEGVGRRFSVMQTAREVFCSSREPNCQCTDCHQLLKGVHPDYRLIEAPEDGDVGVNEIREMIENSYSYPQSAPFKFVVIDGADHMTPSAANALLKTLEEPPVTTRFFLLADSAKDVLPTIRSRCGEVYYGPLSDSFVGEILRRHESNPDRAFVYCRIAGGSVGNAIKLWGSGKLSLRSHLTTMLESYAKGDLPSSFGKVDDVSKDLGPALLILESMLFDMTVIGANRGQVTHRDLEEDLRRIHGFRPLGWTRLLEEIRHLRSFKRTSRVNLAFHLKTALVTAAG